MLGKLTMDIVGNLINWIATKIVLLNAYNAAHQNTPFVRNGDAPSVDSISKKLKLKLQILLI